MLFIVYNLESIFKVILFLALNKFFKSKNNFMSKGNKMTSSAASRIQAATAKSNGGNVTKLDFAARAQSATAKNSTSSNPVLKTGK